MIHKFDFLLLDGGHLVLSDNLNILSSTLLISLSVIVINEQDISNIKNHWYLGCFFKVQECLSTFFNTKFHGLFKNVYTFYPWLSERWEILEKPSGACFVGHPVISILFTYIDIIVRLGPKLNTKLSLTPHHPPPPPGTFQWLLGKAGG